MARREASFICQNCGAVYGRWQGKCDACGEWNTIAEENAATARPSAPGKPPRKGRKFVLEPLAGQTPGRAAPALRHRRVRPRHRRRLRARLGAAARRRSRHRQVDAADPGRRRAGARQASRGLHLGRGSGRAGAAARRAARAWGRRGRTRGRDLGRGHHRDAVGRPDPAARDHRFDPDHVDRHGRIRARHGDPGARPAHSC